MENNLMPMILSSRLRDILMKINDDISAFILRLENNNDYAYSFSFLDITEDVSIISFLQTNKYNDLPKQRGNGDLVWSCSSRNEMRSGRLINKIAPFYKQVDIEKWVNSFKAECKNSFSNINFKIVDGKDIIKFYNGKRYGYGNGSLNKSCMRHEHCAEWMDLYIKNSDKIKMVILLENKKDIISGRALLWKLDDPNEWLLDRIYVKEDSDAILFKKYAEKNGWLYKNSQTFDAVNIVKNKKELFVPMKIYIKGQYKNFPYIDTLLYYNTKDNYLTNDEKEYENVPYIIKLREINGKDSGNEFFVFDAYNNDYIKIIDSFYCYYGDNYTHKNSALFIKEYDEYFLPNEFRYSSLYKKLIPSKDSVYSKSMKTFIFSQDSNVVYFSKDKKLYDYLLKEDVNKKYAKINDNYFDINLLIKVADNEFYFKDEYHNENKLKEKERKIDLIKKYKEQKNLKYYNFWD